METFPKNVCSWVYFCSAPSLQPLNSLKIRFSWWFYLELEYFQKENYAKSFPRRDFTDNRYYLLATVADKDYFWNVFKGSLGNIVLCLLHWILYFRVLKIFRTFCISHCFKLILCRNVSSRKLVWESQLVLWKYLFANNYFVIFCVSWIPLKSYLWVTEKLHTYSMKIEIIRDLNS